jgi:hypothetical protein
MMERQFAIAIVAVVVAFGAVYLVAALKGPGKSARLSRRT